MRETRPSGSVEGVMGDHDPYSDSGCETCFLFRHALSCEILRHRVDVKFHLFTQQALSVAVIEPIAQTPLIMLPTEYGFHNSSSGETHDSSYRPRDLAVAGRFVSQVFRALGR